MRKLWASKVVKFKTCTKNFNNVRFICGNKKAKKYVTYRDRMRFYAVARGRNPGIYYTFAEHHEQVDGFSNPVAKKFWSQEAAVKFMHENGPKHLKTCGNDQSTKLEIAGVDKTMIRKRKWTSDAGAQTSPLQEKRIKIEKNSIGVNTDTIENGENNLGWKEAFNALCLKLVRSGRSFFLQHERQNVPPVTNEN